MILAVASKLRCAFLGNGLGLALAFLTLGCVAWGCAGIRTGQPSCRPNPWRGRMRVRISAGSPSFARSWLTGLRTLGFANTLLPAFGALDVRALCRAHATGLSSLILSKGFATILYAAYAWSQTRSYMYTCLHAYMCVHVCVCMCVV